MNNSFKPNVTVNNLPIAINEKQKKSDEITEKNKVKLQNKIVPLEGDNKNYITLIPECLEITVASNATLKEISQQQNWFNKNPKNLLKQNLIYKKNNSEHRISISPSQTGNTWLMQTFDVDPEGLPIVRDTTQGLQYEQLASKIKTFSSHMNLVSDEQKILIDQPNVSGSVLFINDRPKEIKLFNKENQRLLECQDVYCVCNQTLSS